MQKTKQPNKKILLLGLLTAGVIAAGGFAWANKTNNKTESSRTSSSNSTTTTPNPSNSDKNSKQKIIDNDIKNDTDNPQTPQTNSGKKKVTPIITSSSQLNVSAYVPGVFEEGGKCTATLTQGSATVRKDSEGFSNVSYTQCAPLDLSSLTFPSKGTWALTVSYSSSTAEGVSMSQNIEVN